MKSKWSSMQCRAVKEEAAIARDVFNSTPSNAIHDVIKHSHSVSEHIRNLPEGWKASRTKIETANNRGFKLNPGQTWVAEYRTGGAVA